LVERINLAEEALLLSRSIGFRAGACWSLLALGGLRNLQSENSAARAHSEEALATAREGELKGLIAPALRQLGRLAIHEGESGHAAALLSEALYVAQELGDLLGLVNALDAVAELASTIGNREGELRIAATVAAFRSGAEAQVSEGDHRELSTSSGVTRLGAAGDAANAVWREPRETAIDRTIMFALDFLEAIAQQ
jgi:hypothetical protein